MTDREWALIEPCLPLAASRLRRQCLWWAESARCSQAFRGLDDRDHQALRQGQGLRGSAALPGCRAHLRMVGAMPQTGQGLGKIHRIKRGLDPYRPHPSHISPPRKILFSLNEFRFRLLAPPGGGACPATPAKKFCAPGMAFIQEVQVLCGPRRGGTASLSKGVHREVESEGSGWQSMAMTNRNRIVRRLWLGNLALDRYPDPRPEAL